MRKPFIIAEGKRRYKKLFCISLIKEDLEKMTKKERRLLFISMIKDGKKTLFGVPLSVELPPNTEMQIDVLKEFVKNDYGVDDNYVDEYGNTVINGRELNTIDIYYECY